MTSCPNQAQDQAELPIKFAAICLLPVLIFYSAEIILATLAHNAVTYSSKLPKAEDFPIAAEAGARLHMLGLAWLVLMAAAGVLVKLAFDIKTYFAGPAKSTLFVTFSLVFVAGAVFLGLMGIVDEMRPQGRMGTALFSEVFESVTSADDHAPWNRDTYDALTGATHVAVVLTVAALISGSISCLARFPGLDEKQNWIYQSKRLRTYITLSAGFLVISVLYFKSWADYPGFLLASEAAKSELAQYVRLANAYTSFTGIEYSLVLAAYALPVSYIQARRADGLALQIVMKSEQLEKRPPASSFAAQVKVIKQKEHLENTPMDTFKIIFAIIGPLITGALTNLASAIA